MTASDVCRKSDRAVGREALGRVDDEIRQNGKTSDMVFSVEQIIAEISKSVTLEPGDVILTGTPAGVGKGFNPPRYLKSGDIVKISIEGIGTLVNKFE